MRKRNFWIQYKYPGVGKEIVKRPYEKVLFSLTSCCNLRCWHCVYHYQTEYPGVDASRELVDYVLTRILPKAKYLRIAGNERGEPLISKQFDHLMEGLKRLSLEEVSMITNLTVLNEKKADLILDTVDLLEISLEGMGDFYEKIRGVPWETFFNNLRLLHERNKTRAVFKTRFSLCVTVMLSNIDQVLEYFTLKDFGVRHINFREFVPHKEESKVECLWNDLEKVRGIVKKIEETSVRTGVTVFINFKEKYSGYESYQQRRDRSAKDLGKCYFPWACISVDSEGWISPCCIIQRLGRIEDFQKDIFEFSNTDKFRDIRRTVNTDQCWDVCRTCEIKIPPRPRVFQKILQSLREAAEKFGHNSRT